MQIRPVADPEMVKRILASVQTPELRSVLLKIVKDQRITIITRKRLTAYLTGQRPKSLRTKFREWIKKTFKRL